MLGALVPKGSFMLLALVAWDVARYIRVLFSMM